MYKVFLIPHQILLLPVLFHGDKFLSLLSTLKYSKNVFLSWLYGVPKFTNDLWIITLSLSLSLSLSMGGTTAMGLLGHLTVEVSRSHSIEHTHLINSSEQVISSLQRLLPPQHTTDTRDKHPCPQWDSNLQSQQSGRFRPTHYAVWSPELVVENYISLKA